MNDNSQFIKLIGICGNHALKVDELGHVFGLQHNSSANSVQLPDHGQPGSWAGAGYFARTADLPALDHSPSDPDTRFNFGGSR